MNASVSARKSQGGLMPSVLSALLVSMYIFYLDEGYFNFQWMLTWSNWIIFVIYGGIILGCHILIRRLLFYRVSGWKKELFTCGFGIPLGIMTAVGIFNWLS